MAGSDGGGDKSAGSAAPKLLEAVALACRARQFSDRNAEAYAGLIRRFVVSHGKRHPRELDGQVVAAFLMYLAADRQVSVSTQRQLRAHCSFSTSRSWACRWTRRRA